MPDAIGESSSPAVAELVRRLSVRCEVVPEQTVVGREHVTTGFELKLYGLHEHPRDIPPGGVECARVHEDLQRVARAVLPPDEGPSTIEVRPFDRALHVAPGDPEHDEVLCDIRVLRGGETRVAADESQARCLDAMRARLRQFGVHEGSRATS